MLLWNYKLTSSNSSCNCQHMYIHRLLILISNCCFVWSRKDVQNIGVHISWLLKGCFITWWLAFRCTLMPIFSSYAHLIFCPHIFCFPVINNWWNTFWKKRLGSKNLSIFIQINKGMFRRHYQSIECINYFDAHTSQVDYWGKECLHVWAKSLYVCRKVYLFNI